MEKVGVRKLKENLSRYPKRVKSEVRILVTDRKREVAVIVPCGRETDEDKLLELIQRGIAYWTGGKSTGIPSRIASRQKSLSDAIIEDRK